MSALLVMAAAHAYAEGPNDYRAHATLTLANKDALHRAAIPIDAYRETRRDFADVRVFNGRGEPVPIALAGDPEREREPVRSVELPKFAVTSVTGTATSQAAPEVTVRLQDGTLVEVRGRHGAAPKTTAPPVAYLLDASRVTEPLRALVLDWENAVGAEVVPVRIEASDDFQVWRSAARGASLVRLDQDGRTLEQKRVELDGLRAKYLRITWGGDAFRLRSARGELAERSKPAPRLMQSVVAMPGGKPGEYVFDLGARLPVEALRIVPAETNSVAAFTLATRDHVAGDSVQVSTQVFYRLMRDGVELQSPPLEIGRRTARYWTARVDPSAGGIGTAPPTIEVQWRGAQIVFVARGDPPFTLAFGNPEAQSAWVPVSNLIPGYERLAEMKLPEAKVGAVEKGAGASTFMPEWAADIPPRKIALWAVLVLAVGVLGLLAWRLSRQPR